MSDLLFSDDLEDYRKAEIVEAVFFTNEMVKGNVSSDYFNGAMEMLRRLIRMPKGMARTDEGQAQANILIAKAIDEYSLSLTKKMLMEE